MTIKPEKLLFGIEAQIGERTFYFKVTNFSHEAIALLYDQIENIATLTRSDGKAAYIIVDAIDISQLPTLYAARLALRKAGQVNRGADFYVAVSADDMPRMSLIDSLVTNFLSTFQVYVRFHLQSQRAEAHAWLRKKGAVFEDTLLEDISS